MSGVLSGQDEGNVARRTAAADLTGLARFVSAAMDDALAGSPVHTPRSRALADAVVPLVPAIRNQSAAREGDQAVVDAVVDVMGPTWRPSPFWREQLIRVGRHDLAAW